MSTQDFLENLFSRDGNDKRIATAAHVLSSPGTPAPLTQPVRDAALEDWFVQEAKKRFERLPSGITASERKDLLEWPNRYPDGSMRPISLKDLRPMSDYYESVQDILDRAREGVGLMQANKQATHLGTVARGVPGGGASSRAAKWARMNPEIARHLGFTETTPRPLYRVAGKTLWQHTLDGSRTIARKIDRIFPNIVMTNSESVGLFLDTMRADWKDDTADELAHTILFNQIVLPRLWVEDRQITHEKLYPAGHGDYPYLLARYQIINALQKSGIRFLVFSNADEWLWQADPVMISIAHELFARGHHMLIIGTHNTNNQFGGGFVKKADGSQSLVETPRLPWGVVCDGQAPVALNTTFYLIDVDYLASIEDELLKVEKSLVIKEVPARSGVGIEQVMGVDSWAGDCFAALLNPQFIEWPRLNFLGIKDGGFISGTQAQYVCEAAQAYPHLMTRLIDGDRDVATSLYRSRYCYLGG